jgi:beta-phosphoglucomutase-like phosphatase (HAD superfamily)
MIGCSPWEPPAAVLDQLQALIWDMDGTLIDSGAVVPDAFIATVQAIGGITYTREQVIDLYAVGPPALMLTRLLGRPCTAADLVEYHQRLRATASTIQPYPEIASVLTMLHGQLPMAVFTGASSQAAHMLLGDRVAGPLRCGGGRRSGRPTEAPPRRHPSGM